MADDAPTGLALSAYLRLAPLIGLAAPAYLRRRLARGREDPARWREKLGEPTAPRAKGRLIWLHAVGLGEVLSLRALIAALADGETNFLVTSSARSSAQVFAGNLPPRTRHQYLPLDAPEFLRRFLDHWQPDLSIWAEQDLWPAAVVQTAARGIPLALVNVRLNAASAKRRQKGRALYRDLYARFRLIAAPDDASARHLTALGARDVLTMPPLKAAAPALNAPAAEWDRLAKHLQNRRLWLAASAHAEDMAEALAAQKILSSQDPDWLLILAPRDPHLAPDPTLAHARRSTGALPAATDSVYLADTYGEMGLWYRLAPMALIGGSFGPTEGHNPWEPAALGCAILHGPRTANFNADYATLDAAGAALRVAPGALAAALQSPDLALMPPRAHALVQAARGGLAPLADRLKALMNG